MTSEAVPLTSRDNNFGVLRLLFAALVIVCHSSVLLYGGKDRDPLFFVTHTVTLGDIAVDGFFFVSGYLVLQSLLSSESAIEFIGKRVLRVYPGYLIACLISLLLGFLAGGTVPAMTSSLASQVIARFFFLNGVSLDHAFYRNPMQGLNGSLWTITYEFRCYICLLFAAMLGLSRRRLFMTLLAAVLVSSTLLTGALDRPFPLEFMLGTASSNLRFFSLFASGCVFYLFRDRIPYSKPILFASVALLLTLLPSSRFCTASIAIAGGYLTFWSALRVRSSALSKFTNRTDLSYGLYLYGWPVTQTIVWCLPGISRWQLCALSLVITSCVAYFSWRLIEKPALGWKKYLVSSPRQGYPAR